MSQACNQTIKTRALPAIWISAITLLGLCAILLAWFPLVSIEALKSKDYNEGWNAYRQWMAAQGLPLYGERSALWTTNYPFFSFHLVGFLGGTKGNMVLAGRALCYASLLGLAWTTGAILRGATGSRSAAIYAGLWLFTAIGAFDASRRALDDPEMLSAAFATFGLFAYLQRTHGVSWTGLAAVAFSLSLFTKQDFVAFPVSVALDLLITCNWRKATMFAATGFAASGVLLAISHHLDGPYFLSELAAPRSYGFTHLHAKTSKYLLHFAVPVISSTIILWRAHDLPRRLFFVILFMFANFIAIGFSGGDGVGANIFLPAIIADLLVCVCGLYWLEQHASRLFRPMLVLMTLTVAAMAMFQAYADVAAELCLPASTAAAEQAIKVLQATKGPAICEDLLLCYDAGKPIDYDPYFVKDQIAIGRLNEASTVAMLIKHHYGAIQINGACCGAWRKQMDDRFTDRFQQTMFIAYRPILVSRDYVIFVPSTLRLSRAGNKNIP